MSYFFQLVISGIVVGSIYALSALGFVLIYKSSRVLNIAHGQIIAGGAFIAYTLTVWVGIPIYFSFLASMAITFFLAMSVERIFLRRLIGEPIISVVMVTIGLSSILQGLTHLVWSPDFRSFPEIFPAEPLDLGIAIVPSGLLWGFIFAAVGTIIFILIFKLTRTGVAMRATASDQQAALSMGISVRWIFALSWSYGAVAAVIGGIVIGNISGISIYLGDIGLKVLAVIILGGLDSIGGAILGGLIIVILENLFGLYLDPVFGGGVKDVAPFFILVLIIMIRPYGLFGKKIIERV